MCERERDDAREDGHGHDWLNEMKERERARERDRDGHGHAACVFFLRRERERGRPVREREREAAPPAGGSRLQESKDRSVVLVSTRAHAEVKRLRRVVCISALLRTSWTRGFTVLSCGPVLLLMLYSRVIYCVVDS